MAPPCRPARRPPDPRAGFTLTEVAAATFVMLLGITSSIATIQWGYRALDTARNTTLAAQIIQSEMERIRLLPWDTSSTDETGALKPAVVRLGSSQPLDVLSIFPPGDTAERVVSRFTVTRRVAEVPDRGGEIKAITVEVTWTGIDGQAHLRSSTTQYSKDGLYDYFYTTASRS
jgi:hypothetical protein